MLTVYQSIFDKDADIAFIFYHKKRTTWMCGTRRKSWEGGNKECLQLTN
ncbi:hypothetical protein HMPREF1379_00319 [Enterococcus faecium R497]|nr:hypothetical protein HMPREF1379_00319 [Enterococcus faecium R497]